MIFFIDAYGTITSTKGETLLSVMLTFFPFPCFSLTRDISKSNNDQQICSILLENQISTHAHFLETLE